MNLFVANLSEDVDDVLFESVFSPFGTILSAKVMLDIHTGLSRRYGFVLFEDEEAGKRAMEALAGKPLGKKGNPMSISPAQTSGYGCLLKTTRMYVRNVPVSISREEVFRIFGQFGKIQRVAVKEDDHTQAPVDQKQWLQSTYVIFLQFTEPEEVTRAVRGLHNTRPWPNMQIPLLAKAAESASMRSQRKARQDSRRGGDQVKPGSTNEGGFSAQQLPPQPLMSVPMQLPQQVPQFQPQPGAIPMQAVGNMIILTPSGPMFVPQPQGLPAPHMPVFQTMPPNPQCMPSSMSNSLEFGSLSVTSSQFGSGVNSPFFTGGTGPLMPGNAFLVQQSPSSSTVTSVVTPQPVLVTANAGDSFEAQRAQGSRSPVRSPLLPTLPLPAATAHQDDAESNARKILQHLNLGD